MPIYEYYCTVCNLRFEAMRPMSRSDEPANCPKCELLAARCASLFAARNSDGQAVAGGGSACAGCASQNCASCGSN